MAFLLRFNNGCENRINVVNNCEIPRLYVLSLRSAINNYSTIYKHNNNNISNLSSPLIVDLFRTALETRNINLLCHEMKFDTVCRILCIPEMQDYLIPCFQAVIERGLPLHKTYSCAYSDINLTDDLSERKRVVEIGINLGSFLYVCGYFEESMMVLNKCQEILRDVHRNNDFEHIILKSFYKLLMVQATCVEVRGGNETMMDFMKFMEQIKDTHNSEMRDMMPLICTSICMFYQSRLEYNEAYKWAKKAILSLKTDTDYQILPQVLGKASRACADKLDYERSLQLVKLSISSARLVYGEKHYKYADSLFDYAYYLLKTDNMFKSAYVSQKGLNLLVSTFGHSCMWTAIAEKDIAYIKFSKNHVIDEDAMYRIESALDTMNKLMNPNSLWFAHAYRTKGLLLEENDLEAERLYEKVFIRCKEALGEDNLMTGRAYCNLARVYQLCGRLKKSEELFVKSIYIKRKILGEADTEVAITISLLASLYHDVSNDPKAIELYGRAIDIILGNERIWHSSLEFAYNGIKEAHLTMNHEPEVQFYSDKLQQWNELKNENDSNERMDRDIFPNERYCWNNVKNIFDQSQLSL